MAVDHLAKRLEDAWKFSSVSDHFHPVWVRVFDWRRGRGKAKDENIERPELTTYTAIGWSSLVWNLHSVRLAVGVESRKGNFLP